MEAKVPDNIKISKSINYLYDSIVLLFAYKKD